MIKKILKFFTFWKIVILLLVAGVWFWIYKYTNKSSADTTTILNAVVKKSSIEDSIKVIGSAQLVDEQKIRFNQNWKVAAVFFKDWDKVKKWQIIAQLDQQDILNNISQAEISLKDSRIRLQEKTKWPEQADLLKSKNDIQTTENKIKVANNELVNLQTDKENKRVDLENQINTAENKLKLSTDQLSNLLVEKDNKSADLQAQLASKNQDLTNKTNDLSLLKEQYDLLLKQEGKSLSDFDIDNSKTLETSVTDVRKYLIDADNIMLSIDQVFWISDENRWKNDAFESYLSAKNSQYKINTENDWSKAKWLFNQANQIYNDIQTQWKTTENVKKLLNATQSAYETLILASKSALSAVQASTSTSTYSQTQIDSHSSSMQSNINSAQSNFDKVKTSIVNIEKLTDPTLKQLESNTNISQKKNSIDTLQASLTTLNNDIKTLNNSITLNWKTYETKVKEIQYQISEQQLNINELKNSLKYNMSDYDLKIAQKQNDIENLKNTLDINNESLIVLEKGTTAEQLALAKNDIAKQELSLENAKKNLTKYIIEAPFDGVIRKIDFKVWDNIVADEQKYVYIENPNLIQITATLDQLDIVKVQVWQSVRVVFDAYPNSELTWTVEEVNSTPIESSWVTSYQVKITLDKWQYKIYSWMSAKVYIIVNKKSDILTLPFSFVQKRNSRSFVTVSNNWKEEQREIVTGISTSNEIEIVSGVDEWEKVIRKITIPKSSTSTNTQQRSLLQWPWWWGWWFGWGGWNRVRVQN